MAVATVLVLGDFVRQPAADSSVIPWRAAPVSVYQGDAEFGFTRFYSEMDTTKRKPRAVIYGQDRLPRTVPARSFSRGICSRPCSPRFGCMARWNR